MAGRSRRHCLHCCAAGCAQDWRPLSGQGCRSRRDTASAAAGAAPVVWWRPPPAAGHKPEDGLPLLAACRRVPVASIVAQALLCLSPGCCGSFHLHLQGAGLRLPAAGRLRQARTTRRSASTGGPRPQAALTAAGAARRARPPAPLGALAVLGQIVLCRTAADAAAATSCSCHAHCAEGRMGGRAGAWAGLRGRAGGRMAQTRTSRPTVDTARCSCS